MNLEQTIAREKPRKYENGALAYFREHSELYAGMNRGQLSKKDSGLYRTLLREGTLELAIPVAKESSVNVGKRNGKQYGRRYLSQSQIEEVLAAYETFEGNASQAAKTLPCSRTSVLRRWKKAGFMAHPRGRRGLMQKQIDEICEAYKTFNGNALQASRILPYTHQSIQRYWEKAGLAIVKNNRGRSGLTQAQIKEICEAYETFNGNVRQASRALLYSHPSILKYWRKAGLR